MRSAIITFPGSNCDKDIGYVLETHFHSTTDYIWHRESFENKYDLVIIPGGFSYGDYLRSGALARFSPAMSSLLAHIKSGKKVLGICNGFQILTEAGLLPGALAVNLSMKYICKTVKLVKGSDKNPLTKNIATNKVLNIPIAHGDGRYYADADVIQELKDSGRVFFYYHDENPNGSSENIAGVTSKDFKIAGLMPHPERAMDALTNNQDGKLILEAFI